jgi:hypothetical protein
VNRAGAEQFTTRLDDGHSPAVEGADMSRHSTEEHLSWLKVLGISES